MLSWVTIPSRCLGPVWGALSFHSIQVWEAVGSLQAAFRWRLWEPGSQSAVPFGPWRFGFSQTSAARWGSYSWACAVCSAFSPPSQDRAMGVFSLSACASPQLCVGWLVLTNSVTCYLPSAKHIIATTGSHLFKKEKRKRPTSPSSRKWAIRQNVWTVRVLVSAVTI